VVCSVIKFKKRKVLSFFLKTRVLLVVQMSVGRLFQAVGPATLKACSPNFNDFHGTSKALLLANCRHGCLVVIGCSNLAMWLGEWPNGSQN